MHEIQNMLVFMKISCQKLVFPRNNVPASPGKITACQIIKTNLRDNNKFTFTIWLSLIQDRCSFKIGLHNIKEDTSLIVTKNLCQTNEAIYGSVSCLICNMKCKLDSVWLTSNIVWCLQPSLCLVSDMNCLISRIPPLWNTGCIKSTDTFIERNNFHICPNFQV